MKRIQQQLEQRELESGLRLLQLAHQLQEAPEELFSQSERREEILPTIPNEIDKCERNLSVASNAIKSVAKPNQDQQNKIFARSAVEKDYPLYNGNPQERPLFHKQFTNLCELCDFLNEEIMLKL